MRIFSTLFFLVTAWSLAFAGNVPGCKLADSNVESVIAAKAKELNADEYCQYRIYDAMDDINGDQVEDFIVLFTLEPRTGNDHLDFMTVFVSGKPEPITVETGRRGERDPVSVSVQEGVITLETLEQKSSDPMCCPSGKGQIRYKLNGSKLQPLP